MSGGKIRRGALIVFEGCDKVGKTTQCRKLVDKLLELGVAARFMQFPDRLTPIGKILNGYLSKKEELPSQAIHLLFAANRWECQPKIKELLYEGITLIVDRYSYSGVAYSSAKSEIDFDWCLKPEIGLPKPDLVFFLNLPINVMQTRSGFGEEIYEDNMYQKAVYENYLKLKDDTWLMVDGSKSITDIHEDLLKYAVETIAKAQTTVLQEIR